MGQWGWFEWLQLGFGYYFAKPKKMIAHISNMLLVTLTEVFFSQCNIIDKVFEVWEQNDNCCRGSQSI